MTNKEKFQEVFGFDIMPHCPVPHDLCDGLCKDCKYTNYWLQEYKPKEYEWTVKEIERLPGGFYIDKYEYICEACGSANTYGKPAYCPFCGAKMKTEE